MVLPQFKNNASTKVDGVHSAGSSTITVVDASLLPTLGIGESFYITLWNAVLYSRTKDDPNMEVVEVTGVTGNDLTLSGVTLYDHSSSDNADNMLTEDFFNALETDIAAIEGDVSQNANDISTNASDISTHVADTENPHSTTKDQVGLGNVTNDAQLRADQLETVPTDDDTKVPSSGALLDVKADLQAEIDSDVATAVSNLQDEIDSDVAAAVLSLQGEIDSDIATHTAIADAHHTNANDPTADQKNALTGSHGTPSASNLYLTEDGIGVANGVAELDSGGKVPVAQLPDSVVGAVEYQGTWDADTNTPTLTTTPPEKGWYYKVSVAGTFETVDYEVGDWIISNGTAWEKVDNTDQVTSVFGRQGAVVAQAGDYDATEISNFDTEVSNNVDVAASKAVTDFITITQAVDLDTVESDAAASKAKTDFISITQAVDLDTMESDVAASKTKTDFISITQAVDLDAIESKVDGIEALADVTDADNVAAAGAVMEADTTTAAMSFVLDEDDMASDSNTKLATQQSIKKYVDDSLAALPPTGIQSDTITNIENDTTEPTTPSEGDVWFYTA